VTKLADGLALTAFGWGAWLIMSVVLRARGIGWTQILRLVSLSTALAAAISATVFEILVISGVRKQEDWLSTIAVCGFCLGALLGMLLCAVKEDPHGARRIPGLQALSRWSLRAGPRQPKN
jgi:hypothetical protein